MSDFTRYVPPTGTKLTTTGLTTIFLAGKTYVNAVSVWIANRTAAPVTVTVEWYDDDIPDSFTLCYQYPVAANGILVLEPRGFGLDTADEIRATAGTADALHCIVSTVQIAGRAA